MCPAVSTVSTEALQRSSYKYDKVPASWTNTRFRKLLTSAKKGRRKKKKKEKKKLRARKKNKKRNTLQKRSKEKPRVSPYAKWVEGEGKVKGERKGTEKKDRNKVKDA